MFEQLELDIKRLHEKMDRILEMVEHLARQQNSQKKSNSKKVMKDSSPPLTPEDTERYKRDFDRLFQIWDNGRELQVQDELSAMDADQIRRFADANNLNVTTRTPKERVMQLIGARFRERRQLIRSSSGRPQQ